MLETRSRRSQVLLHLAVLVLVLPFLIPPVTAIRTSFAGQGFAANYGAVLAVPGFGRFFVNSLIIAVSTVLVVHALTMLAAYALAKLPLPAREVWFYAILIGLTLPGAVLIVPIFVTVQRLGLFNTYGAVVLPLSALVLPFTVVLARSYISGLPDELLQAARVDGCNTLQTFRHVVLPLSRPISAVVVLWAFLSAWNEFLLPLLLLQDPRRQVITQVPQYFMGFYESDQTKIIAASVLIALPIVVLYLCLQRLFERGMTAGAIK
jgi:raffinose/stachyose/melibiose transport system permease protein